MCCILGIHFSLCLDLFAKTPSLVMLVIISSGFLFILVNFEQKVACVKDVFFVAFDDSSFPLGWIDVSVSGLLQQKTFSVYHHFCELFCLGISFYIYILEINGLSFHSTYMEEFVFDYGCNLRFG